jgi:RING-variant domain/FHA domain
MPVSVDINVLTWPRDSYGLFDYESSNIHKSSLNTFSNTLMLRKDNEIFMQSPDVLNPVTDAIKLLEIEKLENGHYAVFPVPVKETERAEKEKFEKLWLAVRGFAKGYKLCEGDVIRLGRIKFRVKQIQGPSAGKKIENFKLADILNLRIATEPSEEGGICFKLPCRICLSEVYLPDNPLISPCKCTGTMKYIHLSCLQMCLKSKINTRSSDTVLSFSWKSMSCDLCKKPYPHKFNISGNIVELVEIPKPPEKYLILENICKDKNSNKGLHVVSLYNKSLIHLGRGHDCELRVSDISVSRIHAQVSLIGDSFYLEDHNSKFGTLVQVKRPVALSQYNEYWFQTGRSLSKISVKRPWSLLCSCLGYSISPFDYQYNTFQLFPINTGISLSIQYFKTEGYRENPNLLYEYNQLGFNSSYEEETSCINLIEEVEIADQSFKKEILDISIEKSNTNNY